MDHAIGHEKIWCNNFGVIDKDVAAGDGNGDRVTGRCGEGLTIFERRAVSDLSFHDCSKISAAAAMTYAWET